MTILVYVMASAFIVMLIIDCYMAHKELKKARKELDEAVKTLKAIERE